MRLVAMWCLLSLLSTGAAVASARDDRFLGVEGVEIGYRIYESEAAKHAVVLLNGFTETYVMYDELARLLVASGYRVYTYDHRGQGVSDRLIEAGDVGYVAAFDHYVQDLARFMDEVVRPGEPSPPAIISHSTGGLIAAHYAARHPDRVARLVFSAPYFQANTGLLPEWFARFVVGMLCDLGRCERFAPGQGKFQPETYPFKGNKLTHSEAGFEQMRRFVWGNPALLIRGASSGFVRETMRAGLDIPAAASKVKAPVLLFQAGDDNYVRPGRQDEFCAKTTCKKIVFEKAYHELFFEEDSVRRVVVDETLKFLAQP